VLEAEPISGRHGWVLGLGVYNIPLGYLIALFAGPKDRAYQTYKPPPEHRIRTAERGRVQEERGK